MKRPDHEDGAGERERERMRALEERRRLADAAQAAVALPVHWGEWADCGFCGERTGAYLVRADGSDIPICGDCYEKELDHVVGEQQRERERERERGRGRGHEDEGQ